MLGHVVGGVDEAAEHDGGVSVTQQQPELAGEGGQLTVLLVARQGLGSLGECLELATLSGGAVRSGSLGVLDEGAGRGIETFQGLGVAAVQDAGGA